MGLFLICLAAIVVVALLVRRFFRPPPLDLTHLPEVFIVADLETTGLDPGRHEIIELAAIRVHRDSDRHETFQVLVKPERRVTKKITRITGITPEMLESEGEPLEAALPQFLDFISNHRIVFYNAPFDVPFLQSAAARIGRTIPNPVSDALAMARAAFPSQRSYRLSSLAKAGGLDTKGAHRALRDCRMALTVYIAAASRLRRTE